ncbi:ATP-binding protein [Modestobacter lacusdianchii]
MSWTEQLLPQQSGGTLMGCWDLVVPSDVCGARRRLRAAAAVKAISGAPPDHSVDAPVEVIEEAVEELLLVFEELASNGLRHGQAPVVARVQAGAEWWLVQVTDAAPSWPPQPAVDRDPALGGLGLHLVARLSSDYGWSVQGGRKHVWACLPTPSARPATGGDVSAA